MSLNDFIGIQPKLKELLDKLEEHISFDYLNLETNPLTSSSSIGSVYFDSSNGTVSIKLSADVNLQLGQEIQIQAVNKTDSTIENGKIVYISGAIENRPKIEKYDVTNVGVNCIIGIATGNIVKNEYGYVSTFGIARGLNTQGILEGTQLYATTNGNFSSTIPNDGYKKFRVGICIKEHVSDGWIFVNVKEISYLFGDLTNGNYSLFESNGVMKMIGTSCVWDDLPPCSIIASRLGANSPTLTTFRGNIRQLTFAVNDYVEDNLEFLHYYKEGSNFDLHLHIATNGLEAVNKYVKHRIEYSISDGTSEIFSDSVTIDQETLISANTPDRKMIIIPFDGDILGTNVKIGSVLCFRITRIASTGLAVANNPFLLQFSAHVQKDTIGSRQKYLKV